MAMRTPRDQASFKKALEEDYTKAQQQASGSRQALGVGPERRGRKDPSSFTAKAIRYRGKLIGQKEMIDSENAINKTIDQLAKNQRFKTAQEAFKFKSELRDKFNKTRNLILKAGLKFDAAIAKEKMDWESKLATLNMFGKSAEGIGTYMGYSMGRTGTATDPSLGDPGWGDATGTGGSTGGSYKDFGNIA